MGLGVLCYPVQDRWEKTEESPEEGYRCVLGAEMCSEWGEVEGTSFSKLGEEEAEGSACSLWWHGACLEGRQCQALLREALRKDKDNSHKLQLGKFFLYNND